MDKATARIRRRYDRISGVYDVMERMMGSQNEPWRRELINKIHGSEVLEVGVGTGRNLDLYPKGLQVTGIDLSPGMLRKARLKLEQLGRFDVYLLEADVQALPFENDAFDTVLTSCVFCSVPNPLRGLAEIGRVLRRDGRLIMLEHVLSCKPVIRQAMHLINPAVARIMGANINRETGRTLRSAGFKVIEEKNLWSDIMKLFVAQHP